MALVAEVKTLLDQLALVEAVPIGTPEEIRAGWEVLTSLFASGVDVASVADRIIPGPAGDVPVRIYTPRAPSDRLPVLVWFHGGGFVIGSLDTTDYIARALAEAAKALVVSVGYRLAPEHPYPAARDDGYAALQWVTGHIADVGGDPSRLAVGGDSAGGNLAAVMALMARDRTGPELAFQLLVYPCVDATMQSPSVGENGEGYLLSAETMRWFWGCYLGPDADANDPYVSPLRATDLTGLPPALIITAEYDPLRDEGETYGAALAAAGVPTTVTRYDGEVHAFFAAPAVFGEPAAQALAEAAAALMTAFTR